MPDAIFSTNFWIEFSDSMGEPRCCLWPSDDPTALIAHDPNRAIVNNDTHQSNVQPELWLT
jgi:hypothetical protein